MQGALLGPREKAVALVEGQGSPRETAAYVRLTGKPSTLILSDSLRGLPVGQTQ